MANSLQKIQTFKVTDYSSEKISKNSSGSGTTIIKITSRRQGSTGIRVQYLDSNNQFEEIPIGGGIFFISYGYRGIPFKEFMAGNLVSLTTGQYASYYLIYKPYLGETQRNTDYPACLALAGFVQSKLGVTDYNRVLQQLKEKQVTIWCIWRVASDDYRFAYTQQDLSYLHRVRVIKFDDQDSPSTKNPIGFTRQTQIFRDGTERTPGFFLESGYYQSAAGKVNPIDDGNSFISVNTFSDGTVKTSEIYTAGDTPPTGYTKSYNLACFDRNADDPIYLIEASPASGTDYDYDIGGEVGRQISESVIPALDLDYTKGALSVSSNYINDLTNWRLNFLPFVDENLVPICQNVGENNVLTVYNEDVLSTGTKNTIVLKSYLQNQTMDSNIIDFCASVDIELERTKSQISSDPRKNLPIIVEIILDGNTEISLVQYFSNPEYRGHAAFIYYEKTDGIWKKNDAIDFSTFIEAANPILKNNQQISFDLTLGLKQEKETLNLYSLELFEAYTRGHDFIQENYVAVRPQERDKDDSSETSKVMNYEDNYFVYKYSGRKIDISCQNTNETELYNGWNKSAHSQKVTLAMIHDCDLLLESDVTLGETYGEQNYFIEALKAPDLNNEGSYIYKDSFTVKDYLDVDNGGYDPTSYTDDEIEVITSNIDLLRCKYYNPLAATYENQWCDCSYNSNGEKVENECIYQKLGYCPYRFETEKHPRRIRTLQQSKSNRFNLIQEVSKVFKFYPCFYIEHDDSGRVLLDENGLMKKHVFYMTEKGNDKKIGFRYEKNLSSVSRTLDSSAITTKLYAENIDSSLSRTGLNSIQTATDNIGKTSYVLDFSYYVDTGAINAEQIQRDIYGINKDDFAFLPRIGVLNTQYDKYSNLIITLTGETLTELQAQNEVSITGITTSLEERKKIAQTMYQFKTTSIKRNNNIFSAIITQSYTTSDTYKNYVIKYREQASILWGLIEDLFFSEDYFSMPIKQDDIYTFEVVKYGDPLSGQPATDWVDAYNTYYNKYCRGELFWRLTMEGFPNDNYKPPFNKWVDFKEEIVDPGLYEVNGNLGKYRSLYNEVKHWKKERAKILNKINDLSEQFYKKYEPYIKEGTFSNSNYLTDNEYYWATVQVLDDSCKPKLTYNFSVIDLSPVDDDYEFELADSTYVEDIDFFGINKKTGLPNKEKVIINELTESLDENKDNHIEVINYTSNFSDLFQQITASVQSLTFNENIYKRASNFTAKQYITTESLQDTLDIGDLTLLDTPKDNIVIDENGTEGNDINNTASQYRITGQGVEFSTDGGETWDLGVGPKGINMDYAKFGSLDASKVQIVDGNYIYFLWDKDGINSYRNPATSTSGLVDFARFNRYGLSLIENNNIRLRAGYEYLSNKDGYNTTGNYSEELPLTNQNIGFYLYNDQGQAIFKTETRSAYSEDQDSDYTARLSLTGEMFVTNRVLGSQPEVISDTTVKEIYEMRERWYFQTKDSPATEDATKYLMPSSELKDLFDNSKAGILEIREWEDIIEEGEVVGRTQVCYYNDILEGVGHTDQRFFINEEEIIENPGEPDEYTYYHYTIPDMQLYKISNLQKANPVEALYFDILAISDTSFDTTEQITLKASYTLDEVWSWFENNDFGEDGVPNIIVGYDSSKIIGSAASAYRNSYEGNFVVIAGTVEDQTYTAADVGKMIIDSTFYIFDKKEEDAKLKTSSFSELIDMSYQDENGNMVTNSFYRMTIDYGDAYWKIRDDTGEKITDSMEDFKNSEVGIFINNKKALSSNDQIEDRTNIGDQTISKNASDQQNIAAQEAILSGAERTFMISSLSSSSADVKYNNILSVLKNGVLYLGGTVTDYYGKPLNISGLQYMPDEVKISDPSIVMSRNGQIWCDWNQFYLAYKSNGVYQYTTFSLMDFVNAIQSWSGAASGGGSSGTAAVAGYYFDDPPVSGS